MDDLIPGFVRKGALWIERNHTLQYMRRFATISVDHTSENARYIDLENTRIKAVPLFRWIGSDGTYQNLHLRSPGDYVSLETGVPEGYWLDGVSRLVLSSTPDEDLSGELAVARYTSWPTSLTAEHWLFDQAEDVLVARAMIVFAQHARDAELMAFWQKIFDDGIQGLYNADVELQHSNWDVRMGEG